MGYLLSKSTVRGFGALIVGWFVLASSILGFSGHANASEWPRLSLRQLLEKSGAVIRARAVSVDPSAFDASTNEAFTRVEFEVLEVLAGKVEGRKLSFLLRGGLLPDGMLEVQSLTTNFVPGETSLLFIKDGPYYITPFVHGSAFREATFEGQAVYANQDGTIIDLAEEGASEDTRSVTDARALQAVALGWSGGERATSRTSAGGDPVARKRGAATTQATVTSGKPAVKPLPTAAAALQRVKTKIQELTATDKRPRQPIEMRPRAADARAPSDV